MLAPAARPGAGPRMGRPPPGVEVTFRSAEGVTYFLGEVARQELCLEPDSGCAEPPVTLAWPNGERQRLLRVERGAARPGDVADVGFMGQGFRLVDGPADRSAQVLTILEQLVALNKSAKDNPAPGVVTLVGR